MQLTYRGIKYEHQKTQIEYNEGEIGGKYRGEDWNYRYPRHIPQLVPKMFRQYRGVSYSTRPAPYAESPIDVESEADAKVCSLSHRKSQTPVYDEITQVHLENIRRRLERRLQVAEAKGDVELIKLLRQESEQLITKSEIMNN